MVRLTRLLMGPSPLKKWMYNMAGFNKYGLMHDDCLYENEIVEKALKRVPAKLIDERNFRMTRAFQLSLSHSILPKEQWTKYEEDVRYLQPYIEQVQKELEEKAKWEATHN